MNDEKMVDSEVNTTNSYKEFTKRHLLAILIFIVSLIILFILAIFLVIWWVENSDLGGRGTWTFNQWNPIDFTIFVICLVLLEIVVIGFLSIIMFLVFKFVWYNNLSNEDKVIVWSGDRQKRSYNRSGGGLGFVTFISFLIIVYFDNNLDSSFGSFGYSYWVYTWMKAFILLAILGSLMFLGYIGWKFSQD